MKSKIEITKIKKENNDIKIDYKISKDLTEFFNLDNKF